MESNLEVLRNTLNTQLDDACGFIVELNNAAKRMHSLRMLLYSKRDIAIDKLSQTYLKAEEILLKMKNDLEKEILDKSSEKADFLTHERKHLESIIQDTALSCTEIEDVLLLGKEPQLKRQGVRLTEKMTTLMSVKPDQRLSDVNFLEFVENVDLKKQLNNSDLLGHIRSTELDPCRVKLESPTEKAFVGIEENVTILTGINRVDSLQYLSVKVKDSKLHLLDVMVKSTANPGTYNINFTPQKVGNHKLEITVHGKHIPGSPFSIMACEHEMPNSGYKPSQRIRVSRLTKQAMKDHINLNPDVNSRVADAMIKEELPSLGSTLNSNYKNQHYEREDWQCTGDHNRDYLYNNHLNRADTKDDRAGKRKVVVKNDKDYTDPYSKQKSQCESSCDNQEYANHNSRMTEKQHLSPKFYANLDLGKKPVDLRVTIKNEKEYREPHLDQSRSRTNNTFDGQHTTKNEKNHLSQKMYADSMVRTPAKLRVKNYQESTEPCSEEMSKSNRDYIHYNSMSYTRMKEKELNQKHYAYVTDDEKPDKSHEKQKHSATNSPDYTPVLSQNYFPLRKESLSRPDDFVKPKQNKETSNTFWKTVSTKETDAYSNYVPPMPDTSDEAIVHSNLGSNQKEQQPRQTTFMAVSHQNKSMTNKNDQLNFSSPNDTGEDWEEDMLQGSAISSVTLHSLSNSDKPKYVVEHKEIVNVEEQTTNLNVISNNYLKLKEKYEERKNASQTMKERHMEKSTQSLRQNNPQKDVNNNSDNIAKIELSSTVINATFVRTVGHQGEGEHSTNFPIGVTVTPDNDIAVCDSGSNCVKIFNWAGHHKMTLGSKCQGKLFRPSAVVTNNEGDIFVKDNFAIHVFNKSGTYLRMFGNKLLKRPYGLSINHNGHVVLVDHDKGAVNLVIFDQQGNLIKTAPLVAISSNMIRASKCRFLATYKNKLVVTDLGVNRVFVSDMDGRPLINFGDRGDLPGNFIEPSGVKFDCSGNLIIADSKNDRIQVYKSDGTFLSKIQLQKQFLRRPSDIHVTNDGHLVISNLLGHCVKIFKLEMGMAR